MTVQLNLFLVFCLYFKMVKTPYLNILVNVINIYFLDTGVAASALKDKSLQNIGEAIESNFLLWGSVLFSSLLITNFQANMITNEKNLILKSCYDKNKL